MPVGEDTTCGSLIAEVSLRTARLNSASPARPS